MILEKGLIYRTIYIVGDSTVASWKSQFLEHCAAPRCKICNNRTSAEPLGRIDSPAGVWRQGGDSPDHHWRSEPVLEPDSVLAAIQNHPSFRRCTDLGLFSPKRD